MDFHRNVGFAILELPIYYKTH